MFPKNSPFYNESQRIGGDLARHGRQPEVPVRTPEENQRLAANRPRSAVVREDQLEDWANELDFLAGELDETVFSLKVASLADEVRSHLRG